MITLYKRQVFWTLRVMGHIPGYKRYSRFMTRCYERNFWLTWTLNFVTGYAISWWLAKKLNEWAEHQYDQGVDEALEKLLEEEANSLQRPFSTN